MWAFGVKGPPRVDGRWCWDEGLQVHPRRSSRRLIVRTLPCTLAALFAACTLDQREPNEPSLARVTARASAPLDALALQLETKALAAQAGYYATPARGQAGALTGTDLGWTFAHRDKLWVLFGDSWWIDPVNLASLPDDAVGHISLTAFPDGPSVDAFVRAHPAPRGGRARREQVPA